MVSTIQIKPTPVLQPYISCYALRMFDTKGTSLIKPMHAIHECYMSFFLEEQFCGLIDERGEWQGNRSGCLCTLFTQSHGYVTHTGKYKIFCVQFKSNGFFAIFGIPQKELVNSILSLEDILGNDNRLLTEQLEASKDIFEMKKLIDAYFIKKFFCKKNKDYTYLVSYTSDIIIKNKGIVSLASLSSHANMSFRNFERRFLDEVGMSPKLYARITRFNNVLENKMLHPHKKWTDITYENGYFDQAHLIKEVLMFSAKTPEELFRDTPPPHEDYISAETEQ